MKEYYENRFFLTYFLYFILDHGDLLGSCPEEEALTPSDDCMDGILDESLLETCPIQSPLQVFAGMGGLALIAERLPMLYPEVIQQVSTPVVTSTTQEKPKDSDQFEWVTIEQSGELVYEAPETIAAEPPPIKSAVQTMSPIPAHSLAAFGLFLRLPGYAEVLLKERKHAQCLLRLVLGVTDDGEGSKYLEGCVKVIQIITYYSSLISFKIKLLHDLLVAT